MLTLGKRKKLSLRDFQEVVFGGKKIGISSEVMQRLDKTREFIDFLLKNKIKAYGVTTGLADLKSFSIESNQAAQLSNNLLDSHDAGIGEPLPPKVVLGAMVTRAISLAKGFSGIQTASLQTLLQMINHEIIPLIPRTGSLGASGDLAMLSRLGRAMRGDNIPVYYKGKVTSSTEALKKANINPFDPKAKEGLAITNGTSFIISMLSIAYLNIIHELENVLAMQGLFLFSIGASPDAFSACVQNIRNQKGQKLVAKILENHFLNQGNHYSEQIQDDYCIRCIPQILGPKIEIILEQHSKIEAELNAVTDNPLIFSGDEISPDVNKSKIYMFQNEKWAVLSGGNFHGECLTTIIDTISTALVKIALTLERQITYMLNPTRNKNKLPLYLIPNSSSIGLQSGYMITQYTANALAQKIAQYGNPTSIFNITSANESEDIVSYGASAAERLLEQVQYLKELNTIYLTVVTQACAITRDQHLQKNPHVPMNALVETIYQKLQDYIQDDYPTSKDESFEKRYERFSEVLSSQCLSSAINFPLFSLLEETEYAYT